MNKKIILGVIVVLLIISAAFVYKNFQASSSADIEHILLPTNYTLEDYKIASTTGMSCQKSYNCTTPSEYMVQSNCPYVSLCIKNRCNVVCPSRKE